ncbi:copper amine oxidase N-terminal domain-containing protein [Petroclostridium sp. X23]|uniref:copper amine oxidase N-terminal domain-containing protein n=1 Tax=Petroclostridium sp. X23 TaxID=3045146 RepID=UPI0024AE4B56|nr:copper amine oxidase N-terminal domain-containing protein [Petroclostridium sp. X23]WHH57390.1 copper amine oxidase N-terminal domain-containing protein [Petroclostridium sp. X23]
MSKKIIALVTVLMMVMTIFVPVSVFAAATCSAVGAITSVTGTGNNIDLADLRIAEGVIGNFADGDVITLSLPSGVEFDAAPTVTFYDDAPAFASATVTSVTARVYNIKINTSGVARNDDASMQISLNVKVTSSGSGDIEVNVAAPGTAIAEGNVVVGRFVSGDGTVSVLTTPTKGGSDEYATIRIVENATKAFAAGETIKIKLPSDFTWNASTTISATNGLTFKVPGGVVGSVAGIGTRTLELTVNTQSSGRPSMIDIKSHIDVASDAKKGDITASFSGTAGLSDDVVIGTYADYDVTVTAKDAKEVTAGKDDQRVAEIVVKENIKGSLVPGRTITFTLPDGVRFREYTPSVGAAISEKPQLKKVAGDSNLFAGGSTLTGTVSSDLRTITYTLANNASTSAVEMEFNDPDLDIAANFKGELEIEVGGTAGASGKFVVAEVVPIVTLESDPTDIRVGVQGQEVGDIIITEGAKEAIAENAEIQLTLPSDVTFSAVPTVEVTEGNIELDGISKSGGTVTIKVDTESTKPSVIKVSNIKVTANRSVPEGEIKVSIKGGAIMQNALKLGDSYAFSNVTDAGSVVVANVVTPAPAETYASNSVAFVLGSTTYTVDGVEKVMDVAPFTKDGRTMLPIRFVAEALGVSTDNIIWNEATSQVTIMKGDRVAQMTIGSNILTVNGTAIPMDTAAALENGRTVLPIRFVAQALGAQVGWDEATSTVTITR